MIEKKATRTLMGVVRSAKRDKTVTVEVESTSRHPLYGKVVRKRSKYQVHDAENTCHEGDKVEIQPCRPLSKTKSWTLLRVVEQAQVI